MKKMYVLLFTLFLCFLSLPNLTSAETIEEKPVNIKSFLRGEYSGWFNQNSSFSSYSSISKKRYEMNLSKYEEESHVYFGNPSIVTQATKEDTNDKKGSRYRFLGVSLQGEVPYPDAMFPDDKKTTGDVKGRKYFANPMQRRDSIKNASYRPYVNDWNDIDSIRARFLLAGKIYTSEQVNEIWNMWLANIDDKYSRNQDHWSYKNPNWKKRGTENQFSEMSAAKRKQISYIVQPPTEYTHGLVSTWYEISSGRHYYDNFSIVPLNWTIPDSELDNFKAMDLDVKEVVEGHFEIFFTVKNTSDKPLDTNFALPTELQIQVDDNAPFILYSAEHGIEWKPKETKKALLASFQLPYNIADKVQVTAKFNPFEKLDFEEATYKDNSLTEVVAAPEAKICKIAGSGETKNYSVRVCNSWGYDSETGSYYCSSTICEQRSVTLYQEAELEFDKEKQTLLGVWSRNSKGHNSLNVPFAFGAEPSKEEFEIEIKNHNVVGVDKLKRVIRAGRSVQMYGTMNVKMKIMSFNGANEIEAKKNAFLNELTHSLQVHGVDFGSKAVKNNNGNSITKGIVDKDRTKQGDYLSIQKSDIVKTNYGDSSCTRITRYEQEFEIVIPIKTFNESGKQLTAQGDFVNDVSYNVKNAIADFYTNINTRNGIHGLKFTAKMDGKKIDNSFNTQKVCESRSEKFGIQGNIYDDVRSEDVSDLLPKDNEWDY
ncbi:hypothetical protein [Bacillus badius]|uniref:hypothetical protein n=1 Tax=Bacillus badius TaxID=1455 RepID=UPI0007B3C75D|nr:hypothetical protein [Bacillus badius]KZR59333.1 hypothetical protein A3781_13105 [Bacillus badius]